MQTQQMNKQGKPATSHMETISSTNSSSNAVAVAAAATTTAPALSSAPRRFVLPDPDDVDRQLQSTARARNTLKQAEQLARNVRQRSTQPPMTAQQQQQQPRPLHPQQQRQPQQQQHQNRQHHQQYRQQQQQQQQQRTRPYVDSQHGNPLTSTATNETPSRPNMQPTAYRTAQQNSQFQTARQYVPQQQQQQQQQRMQSRQQAARPALNQSQQQQQQHQRVVNTGAVAATRPPNSNISGSAIIVNPRQRGNPVLKHIKNVAYEFGPAVPDYVLGTTTCALFLSLRYHLLHPDYLYTRISELKRSFTLRVILCHADVQDCTEPMLRVSTLAAANDFTVVLVTSFEEAARYLETYKAFENRSAASIKEKVEADYMSRAEDVLTVIRSVNKTDVTTLLQSFGSMRGVLASSVEELSLCHGFGERKVRFVHETFDAPFFPGSAPTPVHTTSVDSSVDTGAGSSNDVIDADVVVVDPQATPATRTKSISELFSQQKTKSRRKKGGDMVVMLGDSESSDSSDSD